MIDVISKNEESYEKTMKDRFRSTNDITIWLVRYYALVQGEFSVRSPRVGKIYDMLDKFPEIIDDLTKQKHKMIVINDNSDIDDVQFHLYSEKLRLTFESMLPNKSTFEKKE